MTIKYVKNAKDSALIITPDILCQPADRAFLRMEEPGTGIPITVMIFNTDGTFTKIEELPDTLGLQLDSKGAIKEVKLG